MYQTADDCGHDQPNGQTADEHRAEHSGGRPAEPHEDTDQFAHGSTPFTFLLREKRYMTEDLGIQGYCRETGADLGGLRAVQETIDRIQKADRISVV